MAKQDYIWAIGDIHGYASSLKAVTNKILTYPTKKIIFLGDYIDRGPEPRDVLNHILSLPCEVIALLGEHELLLLNAIEGEALKPELVLEWSKFGYETTLRAFNSPDVETLRKNIDNTYLDFFKQLKLFHTESFISGKKSLNLLFSHAGPFLYFPLDEQLKLQNIYDHNEFLKSKNLTFSESCLMNKDSELQRNITAWDNYLLIHGHFRTMYRQNKNRLQYSDKKMLFNYDFSDVPNPIYYPGGAVVAALDIDTGIDVGGKLSAVGFSYENINFGKGRINIKVIQADSSRRTKNIQPIVFDLTLPFTDELNWFSKLLNNIFK